VANKYYVYVYLDPRKPNKYVYGNYQFEYEPFYVGKGKERQWLVHLQEAESSRPSRKCGNPWKVNKIRKILKEGLESSRRDILI